MLGGRRYSRGRSRPTGIETEPSPGGEQIASSGSQLAPEPLMQPLVPERDIRRLT